MLVPDSSPRGCWRSLYKPPEKRTADLQWRVVLRAWATNIHVAHIGSTMATTCPLCDKEEMLDRLFLRCDRLGAMFQHTGCVDKGNEAKHEQRTCSSLGQNT